MKNILSISKLMLVGLLVMVGSMFLSSTADAETSISVNTAAAPVLLTMIDGKLIKDFAETHGWMSAIKSQNKYVNNDAINLIKIGAEPDVLIDYDVSTGIPLQTLADEGLTVDLNKYNTKRTAISDDELYSMAYNKESEDRAKHVRGIEKKKARRGLHNLAPASDAVKTPVIFATGDGILGAGTRMKLKPEDVISLKGRFDKALIPNDGNRHLVLCSDHVNDLLLADLNFQQRFHNHTDGAIAKNYYGFTIWEDVYNVRYTEAGAKVAFEAAADPGDRVASTAFYAPKAWQATGTTKSYYSPASSNPETQTSEFNLRVYHKMAPYEWIGMGAIVSKNAA